MCFLAALRRLLRGGVSGPFASAASTRAVCGQLVRLAGFAALSGVGALVCFERWPKVSVSMFTAVEVSHVLGTRLKSKIGKPKLWETRAIGKVLRRPYRSRGLLQSALTAAGGRRWGSQRLDLHASRRRKIVGGLNTHCNHGSGSTLRRVTIRLRLLRKHARAC